MKPPTGTGAHAAVVGDVVVLVALHAAVDERRAPGRALVEIPSAARR